MSEVNITSGELVKRLDNAGVIGTVVIQACVSNYTLSPTKLKSYIKGCMRDIHNSLSYSNNDTDVSDIGAYLDEDKLLTVLVQNHKVLTTMLIQELNGFTNEMYFLRNYTHGATFYVSDS